MQHDIFVTERVLQKNIAKIFHMLMMPRLQSAPYIITQKKKSSAFDTKDVRAATMYI